MQGWAQVAQGQHEEGLAQMHDGLATLRATGAALRLPYYLALLAEACGRTGQASAGLTLLAEALAQAHTTGESWTAAELHRLKGELLLLVSADNHTEAERWFHQALAIARRQQAKALELRAAMSLSRLWQQQGKRAEARELLASIYGWFTEGFDTADLQEAKALLDKLGVNTRRYHPPRPPLLPQCRQRGTTARGGPHRQAVRVSLVRDVGRGLRSGRDCSTQFSWRAG